MRYLMSALPLVFLPALYSAATSQSPAPPPTLRIGYVSAQRVLAESTPLKAEVTRMQTAQQQKAAELRSKQQTLETTRQQLGQSGDAATRERLQQQEQLQRGDLERSTAQAQTDLQTLQRQIQAALDARVKPVVEDIAKSQQIQIVLNGDTAVIWTAPGLDLTKMVIDRLNAKP